MSALDTQIGGSHYKDMPIQPMEFSMANGLDACQHTVIKYVTRFREKGGVQDLEKAKHVIDMLIEFDRRLEKQQDATNEAKNEAKEDAMDRLMREAKKAAETVAKTSAEVSCECPACNFENWLIANLAKSGIDVHIFSQHGPRA